MAVVKLFDGCYGITRIGELLGPIKFMQCSRVSETEFPFICSKTGQTFKRDGVYHITEGHGNDIVHVLRSMHITETPQNTEASQNRFCVINAKAINGFASKRKWLQTKVLAESHARNIMHEYPDISELLVVEAVSVVKKPKQNFEALNVGEYFAQGGSFFK